MNNFLRKKTKQYSALHLALSLIFLSSPTTYAQDIKISIARLPVVAETREKGVFVDLAKEIAKEYKDGKVTFALYPFSRSVYNVEIGDADIHLPFIRSDKGAEVLKGMGLEYADEHLNYTPFALYFKEKNASVEKWIASDFNSEINNNLSIYTDQQHLIFFDSHKFLGKSCLPCLIKMLNAGRIDGVIFAAREIDEIISEHNYTGLNSIIFKNFDSSPVLRADKEGRILNKKLSNIILKLRKSGRLAEVMYSYTEYYRKRFGIDTL